MIRLVLPYPVSANRYWRTVVNKKTGHAMTFVSQEATSYKSEAGWLAKAAGIKGPLRCAISLSFRLVPDNGVCMDLDNALKVAIDALNGVAYFDDKQVRKITAERAEPDGRARLEVEIEEYQPPQAALFREIRDGEPQAA